MPRGGNTYRRPRIAGYVGVADLAERWLCCVEHVRRLLRAGVLPGAMRRRYPRGTSHVIWLVPDGIEMPARGSVKPWRR